MKTKIKSYGQLVTKVKSKHTWLAVICLDSALNKDGNYYLQVFVKECKYIEKNIIRHIDDNLSNFSSDDDSNDSNKE